MTVVTSPGRIYIHGIGVPNNAARNPSMTPTMGLIEYINRYVSGMDEAVNERLAEAAGRPARDPYINTEEMGDLWNLLLLSGGGICGFIVGRWWHILWGKPEKA